MTPTSAPGRRGEGSIHVDAPPDRVYELVVDVTRMCEWSPELRRCEWADGATGPEVGARFKGWNRRGLLRWATVSRICELEPGRVIGWEVLYPFGRVQTRWRYEFIPDDAGTLVRESFELVQEPPELKLYRTLAFGGTQRRVGQLEEGIGHTLERLKASAEAGAT
jgi:uncharacterized protein YndB with AHSA1/START domain